MKTRKTLGIVFTLLWVVAFALVNYILPSLIGTLYWKSASKMAAICGLVTGVTMVVLTQYVPAIKTPLGLSRGFWGVVANLLSPWSASSLPIPLTLPLRSSTAIWPKSTASMTRRLIPGEKLLCPASPRRTGSNSPQI